MTAMRILIGDTWFPTKSAATHAIREVLYRYRTGDTVSDADAAFLMGVLARHRQAKAKIGCGVASFQVEQNQGSRGFWLTRIDGSRTDWSFVTCLTPKSHEGEVHDAFRTAVRDQIVAFKTAQFAAGPVCCPHTGERLACDDLAHVDHQPPFLQLVRDFLTIRGLTLDDIQVVPTVDGNTASELSDQSLAAEWSRYHATHARLTVVSRRANLGLLKRTNRAEVTR